MKLNSLIAFFIVASLAAPLASGQVVIDNGLAPTDVGYFSVAVESAGESLNASLSARPLGGGTPTPANHLVSAFTFLVVQGSPFILNLGVDLPGLGQTASLPVLNLDGSVSSTGTFLSSNGATVSWTAVSRILPGDATMTTELTFSSPTTLGNFSIQRVLDAAVAGTGEILHVVGSSAAADLELMSLDPLTANGIGQSGSFAAVQGLSGATFDGWAAGDALTIGIDVLIGLATTSAAGVNALPATSHPQLGTVFGPADVGTLLSWSSDPAAQSATITIALVGEPDGGNNPPTAACVGYPSMAMPQDPSPGTEITVECAEPGGRTIVLDGSLSSDPDGDALTYSWSVSDLSVVLADATAATTTGLFPPGVTMATLTVTDGRGGIDTCDVIVTVQDSTPPSVTCTTNVAMLWPPNHKMRCVELVVYASDPCLAVIPVTVTARSNQPDNAPGCGDGNTTGDVAGMDGFTAPVSIAMNWDPILGAWTAVVPLRAERARDHCGRVYTFDVQAVDAAGNVATSSCCVVVPHSLRGRHRWH